MEVVGAEIRDRRCSEQRSERVAGFNRSADFSETVNDGSASSPQYVGRFAPSPTGPLHFGSLVAALASYVDARACKGQWFVRVEDVDSQRCSRAHETTILKQLDDYGFEHDGAIMRQSERAEHYRQAIEILRSKGLAYRCQCSRKTLANARRNSEGEVVYRGTCRNAGIAWDVTARSAVRLNLDALQISAHVTFEDRACGNVAQHVREDVSDFVLLRADGDFAYQLAVVVDDAEQGITDVVRGADLLLNTPRQIVLQRALGFVTPSYLHVPLATNEKGEKLSKQTLAPTLPNAPRERIQTLRGAWAFLRQSALPDVVSTRELLQAAVAAWRPQSLREQIVTVRAETYN
jgi:glutamyl-Q tRNA(Asp) synthetase